VLGVELFSANVLKGRALEDQGKGTSTAPYYYRGRSSAQPLKERQVEQFWTETCLSPQAQIKRALFEEKRVSRVAAVPEGLGKPTLMIGWGRRGIGAFRAFNYIREIHFHRNVRPIISFFPHPCKPFNSLLNGRYSRVPGNHSLVPYVERLVREFYFRAEGLGKGWGEKAAFLGVRWVGSRLL